jgi:cell division cycle protein 37
MNGKHKRMRLVCRQSQILSHIQELGVSMHRDPRDVVLPFFKRIQEKVIFSSFVVFVLNHHLNEIIFMKEYLAGFHSAVEDFVNKIQKRAVEKRKEMEEERRAELQAGILLFNYLIIIIKTYCFIFSGKRSRP